MDKKSDVADKDNKFDECIKDGFKTMVEATKYSNSLPTGSNWNYYLAHESFKKFMDIESNRILQFMNRILNIQDVNESIRNRDLQEKIELVIEANDKILEKVGDSIDEMSGIKKKVTEQIQIETVSAQLPINGSWNRINKSEVFINSSPVSSQPNVKSITLLGARNIIKPQTFFKDKIDNSNNKLWVPRITEKPNSLKPLAIFLEETEFGESYSHPYECELEKFTPLSEELVEAKPVFPKLLEETPLVEVYNVEDLNSLLEDLRKQKVIAVDLEHHSYRSFMGITCLMQISTQNTDYIIDTLALRDKLQILNEVFTKPKIIKVFHGAILDIEWLQRDLSLYVVNMFDTHFAAKELGYSGLSLSYLMTKFCSIKPNKHFQLADWRIRPLPDELKTYARMDTHYLIYIYQMLKNELLCKANGKDNILKSVIQKSTQLCLKRYKKPVWTEEIHLDLYRRSKRVFDNRQLYALKELYYWRDKKAREEDESTGYVLPNHMLLQISEILPREMQGILACCNPIPVLIRAHLLEIHQLILKAREQPLIKPILKEDNRSSGSIKQFFKTNIDSPLYCPHDMSKQYEFRDDLPVLLSNTINEFQDKKNEVIQVEKDAPHISIFTKSEADTPLKVQKLKFLGPFERYHLVKEYMHAEEAKKTEQIEKKAAEEKSDAERIAALHKHFKSVSQNLPEKVQAATSEIPSKSVTISNSITEVPQTVQHTDKTLTKMGGKKRKRDSQETQENKPNVRNTFITPVPVMNTPENKVGKNKTRKRKAKEGKKSKQQPPVKKQKTNNSQGEPGSSQTKQDKNTNTNKRKIRKKQNKRLKAQQLQNKQYETGPQQNRRYETRQHHQNMQCQIKQENQSYDIQTNRNEQILEKKLRNKTNASLFNQQQKNNPKQKQKKMSHETRQQEQNTQCQIKQENNFQTKKEQMLKRKLRIKTRAFLNYAQQEKNKPEKSVKGESSGNSRNEAKNRVENNFKPFDYSTVDYSRFKNSDVVEKQKKINTKYKGKGKNKRQTKVQNKSMTYRSKNQGN